MTTELIRILPETIHSVAMFIFAILAPVAVVKSMKAYSAALGASNRKDGNGR